MSDDDFEYDFANKPEPDDNKGRVIRADLIKKLDRELRPLEAKRDEVNQEIRDKRQQFKSDTGLVLANFDAMRRLAGLEEEALEKTIEELLAVFNTLAPGGQLDFTEVLGDGKK